MRKFKKLSIFVILFLVISIMFTTVAFAVEGAASAPDTAVSGKQYGQDFLPDSFGERATIALQGTVTGMVMVFAVLALLWGIVALSKVVFYDLPNKKKERERNKRASAKTPAIEEVSSSDPVVAQEVADNCDADDGELAAVITAAIAAMLDSEEYKNEFVGGFKVVSFKRSAKSAWNRK